MTAPAFAALLPPVRAIALRAGAVILKHYRTDLDVREKSDASPVTLADEQAEHVILKVLRELTPHLPIVAEEEMAAGHVPDVSGGRFWLVDPLDGTKEFIARRDEFTVNIALIDNGLPVLGVVYAPALGRLYAGAGPGTAIVVEDGKPDRPMAVRRIPEDGAVIVSSRSHGDRGKIEELIRGLAVKESMTVGSSLKFCVVAAGEADIYPRYGPTSEWDTAAGHAVLLAAGGSVRTLDGEEMAYAKAKFRNPEFIARGLDA